MAIQRSSFKVVFDCEKGADLMYALIKGGVKPTGRVRVSGAKNSATRLLAAAMLSDEDVTLSNFPTELVDVGHKVEFTRSMGAQVLVNRDDESVQVSGCGVAVRNLSAVNYDVPIRTTYLLAAAQLVRDGEARIPYPGGCPIGPGDAGSRGYDLHVMVWNLLGCEVVEHVDHLYVKATNGLVGNSIDFPITTVGGTENALICCSVASGQSIINNAYITPEVEDLVELLKGMGAAITITGSNIVVDGAGGILSGVHKRVMSDRIEALTWIVYAAISGGELFIEDVPFDSMEVPLIHLQQAGLDLYRNSRSVHMSPDCLRSGSIRPFELACGSHPGVISDMQAFFVMLGLYAEGTSRVYDYRYPERVAFVSELARLLAPGSVDSERGRITTRGPAILRAGRANSTDLRGSMAVVLAGLCAEGVTRIDNVQMALRGYNRLDSKLASLGAEVSFFDDEG
ncbi:UDP-N-acetylglucosamine 1-carboxyvinyltransferase [Gordonia sp. NPDC127522]|uniref:UDP-N-acetylglucosamine 1-carboxyvinyltransferase n=1 Tax=Gordonia sp. NPDC127522 TaxID=3345390 RepID=UPI0036418D18